MSTIYHFFKNLSKPILDENTFCKIWDFLDYWIFNNVWIVTLIIIFLGVTFEIILIRTFEFFKKKLELWENGSSCSQEQNEDIFPKGMTYAVESWSISHISSVERAETFSRSTSSNLPSEEIRYNTIERTISSDECDYQRGHFCESHSSSGGTNTSLSMFHSKVKNIFMSSFHRKDPPSEYQTVQFSSNNLCSTMKTNSTKTSLPDALNLQRAFKFTRANDLHVAPPPPVHFFLSSDQIRHVEENVRRKIPVNPKARSWRKADCLDPRAQQPLINSHYSNNEGVIPGEARNTLPDQRAVQNQLIHEAQCTSQTHQFIHDQDSDSSQPGFSEPAYFLRQPFSSSAQNSIQAQQIDHENKSQHFNYTPCIVETEYSTKGIESAEHFSKTHNSVYFIDQNKSNYLVKGQNNVFQNAEFLSLNSNLLAESKAQQKVTSLESNQYDAYSSMPLSPTIKRQRNRRKTPGDVRKLSLRVLPPKAKQTSPSRVFPIVVCHTSKNKIELRRKKKKRAHQRKIMLDIAFHLISVSKLITPHVKKYLPKSLVAVIPDLIECEYFLQKSLDTEKINYTNSNDTVRLGTVENTEHSFMVNTPELAAPCSFDLNIPKHEGLSGVISESAQKDASFPQIESSRGMKVQNDIQNTENGEKLAAGTPDIQKHFSKDSVQNAKNSGEIILNFPGINLRISLGCQKHEENEFKDINVQVIIGSKNLKEKEPLTANIMEYGNPSESEKPEYDTRSNKTNRYQDERMSDTYHNTMQAAISQPFDMEMCTKLKANAGTLTINCSHTALKQEELLDERKIQKVKHIDRRSILRKPQEWDSEEEGKRRETVLPLAEAFSVSICPKQKDKCVQFEMGPIQSGKRKIQSTKKEVQSQTISTQTVWETGPCPLTNPLPVEQVKQRTDKPADRDKAASPVHPALMPENSPTGECLIETTRYKAPFCGKPTKTPDGNVTEDKENLKMDLCAVATGPFKVRKKSSGPKNVLSVNHKTIKVKKLAFSSRLSITAPDTLSHKRKVGDSFESIIKQTLHDVILAPVLLNVHPQESSIHSNKTNIKITPKKTQVEKKEQNLYSLNKESKTVDTLEVQLCHGVKLVEQVLPETVAHVKRNHRFDAHPVKEIKMEKELFQGVSSTEATRESVESLRMDSFCVANTNTGTSTQAALQYSAELELGPPTSGKLLTGDPLIQSRERNVPSSKNDTRKISYSFTPKAFSCSLNYCMPVLTHSKKKKTQTRFTNKSTERLKYMSKVKPPASKTLSTTGNKKNPKLDLKTKIERIKQAKSFLPESQNTLCLFFDRRLRGGFCHAQLKQGELASKICVDSAAESRTFYNREKKLQEKQEPFVQAAPQHDQRQWTDADQRKDTLPDEPNPLPISLTQEQPANHQGVKCQKDSLQSALEDSLQMAPIQAEGFQKTTKTENGVNIPVVPKILSLEAGNSSSGEFTDIADNDLESDEKSEHELDLYPVGKDSESSRSLQVMFLQSSDSDTRSFASRPKEKRQALRSKKPTTLSHRYRTMRKIKISDSQTVNFRYSNRLNHVRMNDPQQRGSPAGARLEIIHSKVYVLSNKKGRKSKSWAGKQKTRRLGCMQQMREKSPDGGNAQCLGSADLSSSPSMKNDEEKGEEEPEPFLITQKSPHLIFDVHQEKDHDLVKSDTQLNEAGRTITRVQPQTPTEVISCSTLCPIPEEFQLEILEGCFSISPRKFGEAKDSALSERDRDLKVPLDDIKKIDLQDKEEKENDDETLLKPFSQYSRHFVFCPHQSRDPNSHKLRKRRGKNILFIVEQDIPQQNQSADLTRRECVVCTSSKVPPIQPEESQIDEVSMDRAKYNIPTDGTHAQKLNSWDRLEREGLKNDLQATITESSNLSPTEVLRSKRKSKVSICKALQGKMCSTCGTMIRRKTFTSKVLTIPQCGHRNHLLPKTWKSLISELLIQSAVLPDSLNIIILKNSIAEKNQKSLTQELAAKMLGSLSFSTPKSKENGNLEILDKGNEMINSSLTVKTRKEAISQTLIAARCGTPKQGKPMAGSSLKVISPMPVCLDLNTCDGIKDRDLKSTMRLSCELLDRSVHKEKVWCTHYMDKDATSNGTEDVQGQGGKKDPLTSQHFSFSAQNMTEPNSRQSGLQRINSATYPELERTLFNGQAQAVNVSALQSSTVSVMSPLLNTEGPEFGSISCDNTCAESPRRKCDCAISEQKAWAEKDLTSLEPLQEPSPVSSESKCERCTLEFSGKNYLSPRARPASRLLHITKHHTRVHRKKRHHKGKHQLKKDECVEEALLSAVEDAESCPLKLPTDELSLDTAVMAAFYSRIPQRSNAEEKAELQASLSTTFLRPFDFFISVLSDFKSQVDTVKLSENEIMLNRFSTMKKKKISVSKIIKIDGHFITNHKKFKLRAKMKAIWLCENTTGVFQNIIHFLLTNSNVENPFKTEVGLGVSKSTHTRPTHGASPVEGIAECDDSVDKVGSNFLKEAKVYVEQRWGEKQEVLIEPDLFYMKNLTVSAHLMEKPSLEESKGILFREYSPQKSQTHDEANPEINVKIENNSMQVSLKEAPSDKKPHNCPEVSESTSNTTKHGVKKTGQSSLKEKSSFYLTGVVTSIARHLTASKEFKRHMGSIRAPNLSIHKGIPSKMKPMQSQSPHGHHAAVNIKETQDSRTLEINTDMQSIYMCMPIQQTSMESSRNVWDMYEMSSKGNGLDKAQMKRKEEFSQLPFGADQKRQPSPCKSDVPSTYTVHCKDITPQKTAIYLTDQEGNAKVGEEVSQEVVLPFNTHTLQIERQNSEFKTDWKTKSKSFALPKKQDKPNVLGPPWSSYASDTTYPETIRQRDKAKISNVKTAVCAKQIKLKSKKIPVPLLLRHGDSSNKKELGHSMQHQHQNALELGRNVQNLVLKANLGLGCFISPVTKLTSVKLEKGKLGGRKNILPQKIIEKPSNQRQKSGSGCIDVPRKLKENIKEVHDHCTFKDIHQQFIQPFWIKSEDLKERQSYRPLNGTKMLSLQPTGSNSTSSTIRKSVQYTMKQKEHSLMDMHQIASPHGEKELKTVDCLDYPTLNTEKEEHNDRTKEENHYHLSFSLKNLEEHLSCSQNDSYVQPHLEPHTEEALLKAGNVSRQAKGLDLSSKAQLSTGCECRPEWILPSVILEQTKEQDPELPLESGSKTIKCPSLLSSKKKLSDGVHISKLVSDDSSSMPTVSKKELFHRASQKKQEVWLTELFLHCLSLCLQFLHENEKQKGNIEYRVMNDTIHPERKTLNLKKLELPHISSNDYTPSNKSELQKEKMICVKRGKDKPGSVVIKARESIPLPHLKLNKEKSDVLISSDIRQEKHKSEEEKNGIKEMDMQGITDSNISFKTEELSLSSPFSGKKLTLLLDSVEQQGKVRREGLSKSDMKLKNSCISLPPLLHPNLNSRIKVEKDKSEQLKSCLPPLKPLLSLNSRKLPFSKAFSRDKLCKLIELKYDPQRKEYRNNIVDLKYTIGLIGIAQKGKMSPCKYLPRGKEKWWNNKKEPTEEEEKNTVRKDVRDKKIPKLTDQNVKKLARSHALSIKELQRETQQDKLMDQINTVIALSISQLQLNKFSGAQMVDREVYNEIKLLKEHVAPKEKEGREKDGNVNGIMSAEDIYSKTKKSPTFLMQNLSDLQGKTREQRREVEEDGSKPDVTLTQKSSKTSVAMSPQPTHTASTRIKEHTTVLTRSSVSLGYIQNSLALEGGFYIQQITGDTSINLQNVKQPMSEEKEEAGMQITKIITTHTYQETVVQELKDEQVLDLTKSSPLLPDQSHPKLFEKFNDTKLRLRNSASQRSSTKGETVPGEAIVGDTMKDVKKQHISQREKTYQKEIIDRQGTDATLKLQKLLLSQKLYRTELHMHINAPKPKEQDSKSEPLFLRKMHTSQPSLTNITLCKGVQVDKERLKSTLSSPDAEKIVDKEAVCGHVRKGKQYKKQIENTVGLTAGVHSKGTKVSPISHLLNTKEVVLNMKFLEKKVHKGKSELAVIATRSFLSLPSLPSEYSQVKTQRGTATGTGHSYPQGNCQEAADAQEPATRESAVVDSDCIVKTTEYNMLQKSKSVTSAHRISEHPQVEMECESASQDNKIHLTRLGTIKKEKMLGMSFKGQKGEKEPSSKIGHWKKENEFKDNLSNKTSPKFSVSPTKISLKEALVTSDTLVCSKRSVAEKKQETGSASFMTSEKDRQNNATLSKMLTPAKMSQKKEEQNVNMEEQAMPQSKSGQLIQSKSFPPNVPVHSKNQRTPLQTDVDKKTAVNINPQTQSGVHMSTTEFNATRRKEGSPSIVLEQEQCDRALPQKSQESPLKSEHLEETNTVSDENLKQTELEMDSNCSVSQKEGALKAGGSRGAALEEDRREMQQSCIVQLENKAREHTSGPTSHALPPAAEEPESATQVGTSRENGYPPQEKLKRELELSTAKQNIQGQKLLQTNVPNSLDVYIPDCPKSQKSRFAETNLKRELKPKYLTMRIPKHPVSKTLGIIGHCSSIRKRKLEYAFNKPKTMVPGSKCAAGIIVRSLCVSMISPPHNEGTVELETNPRREKRVCHSEFQKKLSDARDMKDILTGVKELRKLRMHLVSKSTEIKLNQIPEIVNISFQKCNTQPQRTISEDYSCRLCLKHTKMNFTSPKAGTLHDNLENNYRRDFPPFCCVKTMNASNNSEVMTEAKDIKKQESVTSLETWSHLPLSHILQKFSEKERDNLLLHSETKALEIQTTGLPRIAAQSYAMASAQDKSKPFFTCIHSATKEQKRTNRVLVLFDEKSFCEVDRDLQCKYLHSIPRPSEPVVSKVNVLPKHTYKLDMGSGSECKTVEDREESSSLLFDTDLLQHVPFQNKNPRESSFFTRKFQEPPHVLAFSTGPQGTEQNDMIIPSELKLQMTPEKDKQCHVCFQETSLYKHHNISGTQQNTADLASSYSSWMSDDWTTDVPLNTETSTDLAECPASGESDSEECVFIGNNFYLTQGSQKFLFEVPEGISLANLHRVDGAALLKPVYRDNSNDHHTRTHRKHPSPVAQPCYQSRNSRKHKLNYKMQSPDGLTHSPSNIVEIDSTTSSITFNEDKHQTTTTWSRTSYSLTSSETESNTKLNFAKKYGTSYVYPQVKERRKAKSDLWRKFNVDQSSNYNHSHHGEKQARRKRLYHYESKEANTQTNQMLEPSAHQQNIKFYPERRENQPFFYACVPADSMDVIPQTIRWLIPSKILKESNFHIPQVASISKSWNRFSSSKKLLRLLAGAFNTVHHG